MSMSSRDYRESLREYRPRVSVKGRRIESVADEPLLAPGINAIGLTCDYALNENTRPLAVATQHSSGELVNRLLHITRTTTDLLTSVPKV